MTTLEKRKQREHSPETIDAALLQCALDGGNTRRASRKLKARGIDVPRDTLKDWVSKIHPDRYKTFAEANARRIEESLVVEQRELGLLATEVAHAALEAQLEQLRNGEVKDPSTVARNAETVGGIAIDKVLGLSGRPNVIVEHRAADELMRALAIKAPQLIARPERIVDAEVEPEADEQTPALPATHPDTPSQRT